MPQPPQIAVSTHCVNGSNVTQLFQNSGNGDVASVQNGVQPGISKQRQHLGVERSLSIGKVSIGDNPQGDHATGETEETCLGNRDFNSARARSMATQMSG